MSYFIVSLDIIQGKRARWITAAERWPGMGVVRVQAQPYQLAKHAGKSLLRAECTCPFPRAAIFEVTPIDGDPKPFEECALREVPFEECGLKGRVKI